MNEFVLLESSGIVDNGQKKNYRATYTYGEHKVRVTIELDTSYPRQSSCAGEVWSPAELAWHPVATMNYSEWTETDGRTYHRPGGAQAEDVDILNCDVALQGMVAMVL